MKQNRLSTSFAISLLCHLGFVISVYAILNMTLVEPSHEEVSIQIYAGSDTGTGEQGSTRPALKRQASDFSEGKRDSTKAKERDGAEDGYEDGKGVDWGSASDPALDSGRYTARIVVDVSPDDYPLSARRSNLGNVVVAVTLYVSSKGTIRDVRIRHIRAGSGDPKSFERDFVMATRNIFLRKARLVNLPYSREGKAHDFIWDTTVTYTLR
jgi:hypothetical protein